MAAAEARAEDAEAALASSRANHEVLLGAGGGPWLVAALPRSPHFRASSLPTCSNPVARLRSNNV